MNAQRGAVLVESAIVLTALMAVIYGSIQLGTVGLEQLTVDGGAFTAAHQQSLLGANAKGYEDAATLAKSTLTHLNSSNIQVPQPIVGEPPIITVQGQYSLTTTNARHGGVSLVQPAQAVSSITSTKFAGLLLGLGNSINVTGIAIDPAFRLINGHGNVGGNSFNSTGAFATASDPLVDGNNAPPYFIGFNYIKMCPLQNSQNKNPWTAACPAEIITGLGLAEYLDVNNWGRAANGVVPVSQAVFAEALLHQNKFAAIATHLQGVTDMTTAAKYLDPTAAAPNEVRCVYSFDNENLGTYSLGTTQIGNFPLTPAGDPAACGS